jgi:hypothetical protein
MQRNLPWRICNISLPLNLIRSSRDCLKILLHLWLHVLEILHCRTIVYKFALKVIKLREVVIQEILNFIL